jgi:adenylate cyclase
MPFNQIQCADLKGWNGDTSAGGWQKLQGSVAALVKGNTDDAGAAETTSSRTQAVRASICVLPFVNMSGEPEQEYFSDGISEDITTDLSKVSALEVVARNTAFAFKGQNPDVQQVAKQLNVSHVLEGSVRKAGGRVRINAQLIDGTTGKHLWADRYDRDLTDIFEIQDEISKAIVDALKVKLLPAEKKAIETRGTSSADAYNLYLMARQQWITGSWGDLRRDESIVRLCRQATTLDPQYAHAWALMALAQLELRFLHGQEANALPAAEQALEIDPTLAEAHCIKARYLEEEGRAEEAEKQIRTALKLDPESWEVNREAARMMFRHGHLSQAIPFFQKAMSLMELDFINAALLCSVLGALGDSSEARRAAKIAVERSQKAIARNAANGTALATGAYALAVLGEDDRAREWLHQALLLDPDNLNMRYNAGCVAATQLKDPDEALKILEPFFQTTSTTWIRHCEADPDLDPVRDDPRFQEMVAAAKHRLGMSDAAAEA